MILHERGLFDLDDPIETYLPEFSDMRVLGVDAESLEDTVPAGRSITPRYLLSHTAGLSYGFVEPESLIDQGYLAEGIDIFGGYDESLADLCGRLGELPLVFQPGTGWRYSLATDVMARLIEVLSGDCFDSFLEVDIFAPLDMVDTGFDVPPAKHDRFVTMYAGPDPLDYTKPGLSKVDDPRTGVYSRPRRLQSGGGGLVSTLSDYATFIEMIIGGGQWHDRRIITDESLDLMRTNQLAEGVYVNFPDLPLPGTMFGLGFSLLEAPGPEDPPGSDDQYGWGGMAGTSSWMAPNTGVAGICFTQRMPAGRHPYMDDFRRLAYASG
jgi:CubicO group peptidase (beta-lactamase class C family)